MKVKARVIFWTLFFYLQPFASIGLAVGFLMFMTVLLSVSIWFTLTLDPIVILASYMADTQTTLADFGAGLFLLLGFLLSCLFIWKYGRDQVHENQLDEIQQSLDQLVCKVSQLEERL